MRDEIAYRSTATTAVLNFFREHPLEWLNVHQLAHVAGFAAWRTRVSDARKIVKREGGDIVWNHKSKDSCYRYHPQAPLGRDAGAQVPREWQTDGPFTRHEPMPLGQQALRFK